MDKLRLIRFFLSVVEKGSFAAAAQYLGVSPSTVSKAVARLEEGIKVQLFQRSTRQLKLTLAGEKYVSTARMVIDQLDECEHSILQANDKPQGVLRVNVPVSYGRLYIRPMFKKFYKLYPKIELDISFSDKHIDIINGGFDVCIRSGTVSDSRTIVRQLSPMDFLICSSPVYLEKYGYPKSKREFSNHAWVRFRFQQTGQLMPVLMPGVEGHNTLDPDRTFIVDDGETMAELCADGLGLSQMPHFIARNWLRKKLIVPLFPVFKSPKYGIYLLYPKREYQPARVRAFISFVCEELEGMGESPRKTWASDLKRWAL